MIVISPRATRTDHRRRVEVAWQCGCLPWRRNPGLVVALSESALSSVMYKYGLSNFMNEDRRQSSKVLVHLSSVQFVLSTWPEWDMLEIQSFTAVSLTAFRGALYAYTLPIPLSSHGNDSIHEILHLGHHLTVPLGPSTRRVSSR